jgi:hypothetical protein
MYRTRPLRVILQDIFIYIAVNHVYVVPRRTICRSSSASFFHSEIFGRSCMGPSHVQSFYI